MTPYYIVIALLLFLVGWLLVYGRQWPAVTAAVYAGFAVMLLVTVLQIAGRPKPIWLEFPKPEKLTVIAFKMVEPEAIYLLVQPEGEKPKLLELPWTKERAKQLHTAARMAEQFQQELEVQIKEGVSPGGEVLPGDPKFYPKPPEALPPKNAQTN